MTTAAETSQINILHSWPRTRRSRLWSLIKIVLKEALWHGHWAVLTQRRKVGGGVTLPKSVVEDLRQRGLPFSENDFSSARSYKVCLVLRDVECLRWAIREKSAGRIDRLIAGPLIVNFPDEGGGIAEDPLIDLYLLPSEWIKNLFLRLSHVAMRIQVWPLGIDTKYWSPALKPPRTKTILVYDKNPEPHIRAAVLRELTEQGLAYRWLRAGQFERDEFRELLRGSRAVLFLSRTETQGLAMFEAWSCGVPTFHWNPGSLKLMSRTYPGASSCPYLSPSCGLDFKDEADLKVRFQRFLSEIDLYRPRAFVEADFQLSTTVDRLLSLAR